MLLKSLTVRITATTIRNDSCLCAHTVYESSRETTFADRYTQNATANTLGGIYSLLFRIIGCESMCARLFIVGRTLHCTAGTDMLHCYLVHPTKWCSKKKSSRGIYFWMLIQAWLCGGFYYRPVSIHWLGFCFILFSSIFSFLTWW